MKKFSITIISLLLITTLTACGVSTGANSNAVNERANTNAGVTTDNGVVTNTPEEKAQTNADDLAKAEREKNADFVVNNTKGTFAEVGGWYTCKLSASKDTSDVFDGYFMPLSYEIKSEFNGVAADEGYEWKVLEYLILEDINESNDGKGRRFFSSTEDYYNSSLLDDTYEDAGVNATFTVKYNDQEYVAKQYNGMNAEGAKWSGFVFKTKQFKSTYAVMVPKGYDGTIFALYNPTIDWPDDKCFCEVSSDDSVMFRMANDNTGSCVKQPTFIDVDGNDVYKNTAHAGNIDYISAAYSLGNIDYETGKFSLTGSEGTWFTENSFKKLDNGTDSFSFNDYGSGVLVVQTAITHKDTPGSSMHSVWQNQGVIFDFDRNICYCAHMVTEADYDGLYGVAYPIVYEQDGSVKLSKNVHCVLNGINVE